MSKNSSGPNSYKAKVKRWAISEAEALGQKTVYTEHLLLGILEQDKDVAEKLRELGIKLNEITREINQTLHNLYNYDEDDEGFFRTDNIDDDVIDALTIAEQEALTREDADFGGFDVINALLKDERAETYQLLAEHGLDEDVVGAILQELHGDDKYDLISLTDLQQKRVEKDKKSKYRPTIIGKNGQALKMKALKEFGDDITQRAYKDEIEPIVGRDKEIEDSFRALRRRKKNNPVIIGEAGVGKTAIVDALAQAIVDGKAPKKLQDKHIISLDLSAMVAGTTYRGQFEARLKAVMDEVKQADGKIVLFMDELHTLVGAGSAEGSMDASNILKPALSRGEIKLIGATTLKEYRKIEKDGALARRFQPIKADEPSLEEAQEILAGAISPYAEDFNVIYPREITDYAVKQAKRYLTERYLPDSAFDLLDEAGAAIALKHNTDEDGAKAITATEQHIDDIIATMTGIPVGSLNVSDLERMQNLEGNLNSVVIGQEAAVKAVSKSVRRARSGLADENRPNGSFLFLGPTGTGKTYLTKNLTREMTGDEDNIIRIDMSEYMEKFTVSRLIGSPPGYVGSEDGGQLTEAVRRKPYSTVLFDEIEKAHPDVFNILLQVLDDGHLTDSQGNKVDFKNTTIVMTSNIGAENFGKEGGSLGFGDSGDQEKSRKKETHKKVLQAMQKRLKPEFINRIDEVVIFDQLQEKDMRAITDLELAQQIKRAQTQSANLKLIFSDAARDHLAAKGYDPKYGARPLKRAIQKLAIDEVTDMTYEVKNPLQPGSTVKIDAKEVDGEMALTFKAVAGKGTAANDNKDKPKRTSKKKKATKKSAHHP